MFPDDILLAFSWTPALYTLPGYIARGIFDRKITFFIICDSVFTQNSYTVTIFFYKFPFPLQLCQPLIVCSGHFHKLFFSVFRFHQIKKYLIVFADSYYFHNTALSPFNTSVSRDFCSIFLYALRASTGASITIFPEDPNTQR